MDETIARNILCVEDEPEMIDLIRLILSRKGFNVQGAAGGVEGIRLIRELRPNLVLLDLMMPDMDGMSLLRILRHHSATERVPVALITAHPHVSDEAMACAGVRACFHKPFDVAVFLASVHGLCPV